MWRYNSRLGWEIFSSASGSSEDVSIGGGGTGGEVSEDIVPREKVRVQGGIMIHSIGDVRVWLEVF